MNNSTGPELQSFINRRHTDRNVARGTRGQLQYVPLAVSFGVCAAVHSVEQIPARDPRLREGKSGSSRQLMQPECQRDTPRFSNATTVKTLDPLFDGFSGATGTHVLASPEIAPSVARRDPDLHQAREGPGGCSEVTSGSKFWISERRFSVAGVKYRNTT